jgi:DNA mismatch repair protein MutS
MAQGIVGEYLDLKRETDADLLAMQVGDFYEFFADDARTVADELELKTSTKGSGGDQYTMAGVPVDDLTPHLKALVERGYRVAVADQGADDTSRSIRRVATPGTLTESTDAAARYVVAVARGRTPDDGPDADWGLAVADATTGDFRVTTLGGADAVRDELRRLDPVEVLPGPATDAVDDAVGDVDAVVVDGGDGAADPERTDERFAPGRARAALRGQFGEAALDTLGLSGAAVRAAGAVVDYLEATDTGALVAMTRLRPYGPDDYATLDATTRRNLELVETMRGDRDGSLLERVDHTVTAAGGRLLREWLVRPRTRAATIRRRLDSVGALVDGPLAREALREHLSEAADLERIAGRAAAGRAGARDLLAARRTLGLLPDVAEAAAQAGIDDRIDVGGDRAAALHDELGAALVDDPPASIGDGGTIRRGYDDDLDALIDRHEDAREWIDGLAQRERDRHGITHLQVDRNKTDGYYIQVGQSETDRVPDSYERIKSLKTSERYTTPELDEREREILRVEEARAELERELFAGLRDRVAEDAPLLQDTGRAIAELDVLASLATHAVGNGWVRPSIVPDSGGADSNAPERIDVRAGRHPVVEGTTEFVPNDAVLGDGTVRLVTGPNMSGKSTYMRQVALIVLLAQIGSFVPADEARIAPVDGIYTRVGALDELAQGRSTFMVEMAELANILHAATADSLVVLDEVGRGTATYDGIAIAWAATEALVNEIGATTLFATHYHELTALADRLDGVENVHMAAEERDGEVTFLWTVADGPADRSYGVHVADLAGVPAPVVDRAADVLDRLREQKAIDVRGSGGGDPQQVVFDLGSGEVRDAAATDGGGERDGEVDERVDGLDPDAERVLDDLQGVDVSTIRPVDLMARVREWQDRLEE